MSARADGADFVLASASPRRRALLSAAGLNFARAPVALDESARAGEDARALVQRLALAKAQHALSRDGGARPVLGADTVVALAGRVLGKPRDAAHALEMLTQLAGQTHEVWSGVALCAPRARAQVLCVRSTVTLRRAEASELRAYIESGEPLDKAGAYALQGEGARFVERVDGSLSNVIGLPLAKTLALLEGADVRARDAAARPAEISARLADVRARVRDALARAGRAADAVTLVGVSKGQPPGAIFFGALEGLRSYGENYAQELRDKAPAVAALLADVGAPAPRWRFIGQLQRNKARVVVPHAACVESVDRESLARELDRHAREAERTLDVLLQVRLDDEVTTRASVAMPATHARATGHAHTTGHTPPPSPVCPSPSRTPSPTPTSSPARKPPAARGGATLAQLPALCEAVARCTHLRLCGLMTLPEPHGPEHARRVFALLFEAREALGARALPELSMGSSADFELAIAEGASIIRVGTHIFGPRGAR